MNAMISRARREDAFALAALQLQMDRHFGATVRPGFINDYADAFLSRFDSFPSWLATSVDGAALGFVQCTLMPRLPKLDRPATPNLHVGNLFVSESARGQGLGERLLQEALTWAREQGVYRVTVNAEADARSLYERVGFGAPEEGWMDMRLTTRAGCGR